MGETSISIASSPRLSLSLLAQSSSSLPIAPSPHRPTLYALLIPTCCSFSVVCLSSSRKADHLTIPPSLHISLLVDTPSSQSQSQTHSFDVMPPSHCVLSAVSPSVLSSCASRRRSAPPRAAKRRARRKSRESRRWRLLRPTLWRARTSGSPTR